ncbi:hypothetical protein GPECTOR_9g425 [Gonium pectorale]|uniref:Probable DNA helicase MCM8 n=1 Tax=Gonium pectorale TaxID=33097 RepID=A0A150GRD9_GONPE|nr:hypothetical protein GPECTOR_9g425 [Gonium pectorale]|eukprot:KXZ52381.1 hypothetical protein GPECTOR_9g425 [Gonium pectorale]
MAAAGGAAGPGPPAAGQQRGAGPPAAWADYFPPNEYTPGDRRVLLINDLLGFFVSGGGHTFLEALRPVGGGMGYALEVDFEALAGRSGLPDLPAAIEGSPLEALGCIAVAAHEAAFAHRRGRLLGSNPSSASPGGGGGAGEEGGPPAPGRIAIRLVNHPASATHIRGLKSSSIGKLVTLRGTVVRMSPVRPLVTSMDFVCAKCGARTRQALQDGVYALPAKCSGEGCRSRTFTPHRSSARCVDWQKIRIQELLGSDKAAEGQVPRSVEVELCGDLVHGAVVGDVVTVVGIVKVMATGDDLGKFAATGGASGGGGGGFGGRGGGGRGGGGGGGGGRGGGGSSLFLMYLEAVSLSCPRQQLMGAAPGMQAPALSDAAGGALLPGGPSSLPSFIAKDLAFVVKFCESYGGDQLRQLVHALCPAIYGHELVKAGLVLALLGGVRKHAGGEGGSGATAGPGGGCRVPVRGDIHLLLARQLESLVRLAEARARAELREVVSREDAEDVVDLVREALYDRFGSDLAAGCTDYRAMSSGGFGGGGGRGSRGGAGGEAARFMAGVRRLAAREGRCVFGSGELTSLANEMALAVRDVGALLEQLNEAGQLLKRGPGQYKVEGVALPAASQGMGGSVA